MSLRRFRVGLFNRALIGFKVGEDADGNPVREQLLDESDGVRVARKIGD